MLLKLQESAENYLETILILGRKNGNVRSVDVAEELEYTKPSVSVAMKKLREGGHVVIDADGFIKLTESGRKIAEAMYERHIQISEFLMTLGVDEETAVEDACKIEHFLSAKSYEAIKEHAKTLKNK